MKKLFLSIFFIISIFILIDANTVYNISLQKLDAIKTKYGEQAYKRVLIWDKTIQKAKQENTLKKLKIVNDFFNLIPYERDITHWHQKDYWAAPFEFLGTGAGDCEDYAIAKYFSLRELGIADEKLRITYVKLLRKNSKYEEAHMVLTYYHTPTSTPIVLDNVNKKLQLATKRDDLKPVYSFNANGLWKAKNKGQEAEKIGENNLKSWKDLMSRI